MSENKQLKECSISEIEEVISRALQVLLFASYRVEIERIDFSAINQLGDSALIPIFTTINNAFSNYQGPRLKDIAIDQIEKAISSEFTNLLGDVYKVAISQIDFSAINQEGADALIPVDIVLCKFSKSIYEVFT